MLKIHCKSEEDVPLMKGILKRVEELEWEAVYFTNPSTGDIEIVVNPPGGAITYPDN